MAPHLFGYKVATRPSSAPFQRAKCPEKVASTPLWRTLPGRKPGQRQGSCSPRLKPLGHAARGSQESRARSASPASTEAEAPEDATDSADPEKRVVSAREWHVSDQQIQQLVERLQTQEETPSAPCVRLRPVASPCQVNRPLLCCGRLKRPIADLPEATPGSSLDSAAAEREQWAARAAREDYEAREAERIKYYFRKPKESDAMASSQEMARCASAPSQGRRKEAQQVTPEAGRKTLPKSKSEVLVTLNFMDTGDKYTLQVDPDLRIGPCAEDSAGLKGIIEEITGVPAPNQILFCKRCKMGNDRHTLRSYHAHDNAEVLVRFKPQRSKFPQACTVKWRQQQQLRLQRRERAREYCVSQAQQAQHRIQPCWQRCVVPQNGTFFQYAKRGMEGKLAQRFDLHWNDQAADIRTNLFHDPFASFGDYHTFRPDEHSREWERSQHGTV